MFMYETKGKIGITFKDDAPVTSPEYVVEFDEDNKVIYVNGQPIKHRVIEELSSPTTYPTARIIEEPVAINLNRQSISIPEDTVGDGVFHVVSGGHLTIDGDGIVNGVGNNDYNMAIWADGGSVVINGGTYTNEGATGKDDAHFDLVYVKDGGKVEITGGYFKCETPKWTLNSNDTKPGTIIVKGGTFYKYDPSNSDTEPGSTSHSFVAPGYTVKKNGDEYTVVKL